MLSYFSPEQVKFGDEKSLERQGLLDWDVRRDPITGKVPPIMMTVTFAIHSRSLVYAASTNGPLIHQETNNSEQSASDIKGSVATGSFTFWRCAGLGQRFVFLDNASYHTGKGNSILA